MSSDLTKNESREQKTARLTEQAIAEIKRYVKSADFGVLQIQLHVSNGNIDSLRVLPEKSYK
jgi:uncharacterized protein with FMN-binding domain